MRDHLHFITVKSPHLRARGDICVYLPETAASQEDLPLYILLHGVYGSAWAWALKGGAHLTADRLIRAAEIQAAIVVMPSDGLWGDGSAYFKHHHQDFAQWIVSDVPQAVIECFPAASQQSPLCIGGLSMGGYGALSLGSRFAERFSAISGHSAITDLQQMTQFVEEPLAAYEAECEWPNVLDSILHHRHQLPPLRFDCGQNDSLLAPNRQLHQALKQAQIPHTYTEFSGGHEWPYWQEHVEKTFRFFDQSLYPHPQNS
ncbi:MAG: alpha/beta hydrolase-fold protein [Bacteroidota bacterium]